MFNASYFTYDNVFSGYYDLQIADFDAEPVNETAFVEPELVTLKTARSNRFFFTGVQYNNIPQYPFSIISPNIIDDNRRRAILQWLIGRNGFKTLVIHQRDLESYTYRCVFTNVDIIYVNGYCHGFRVTANFDSQYAYQEPTVITSTASGSAVTVNINNESDIDGYVYPVVDFTASAAVSDKAISITNTTDSDSREFALYWYNDSTYPHGVTANEDMHVDNDLHIISSSLPDEKLSCFNKNWLRLRPGNNVLSVTINGSVTITCPKYSFIGF